MKIPFTFSDRDSLGGSQAKVSEILRIHLKAGKDFFVLFCNDKASSHQRGFYRICGIIAPYMAESEGTFFGKDMVKQYVAQETNFCAMVKGRVLTKGLIFASRDEMAAMITRLYELAEFYNIKDYKLTSAEKRSLVDFFNNKK